MCACAFLFLTRFLFDRCNRCQIVTDTSKKKFVGKPFKPPSSLHKWKRFDEASLFNLHHLYFNYHLLMHSKVVQFLEDLDVITALNHSGSFGKNLVKFGKKKMKMLFTSLGRSVFGKTVPSVLNTVFPNTDLRLANNMSVV